MLPLLIGLQFLFQIPFGGSFILLVPLHNGTKSYGAQGILHVCIHPIKTRAIVLLILYECAGRRIFLNVEHDITSAFQIEHGRHIDDLLVTLTQDFFQYAELFLRR